MKLNDCECIQSCFKTILEMLQDRNYIVNDNLKKLNSLDFRYMYNNNKYNFDVTNNNNKCYIMFFLKTNSIKLSTIRDSIENTDKNTINEYIIIVRNISNNIKKLEKEYNCNIFHYKDLQVNKTKHKLVPKHELIESNYENTILKKLGINNKNQLQIILLSDPISKYYNFKSGNIIKITRNSITSGNNIVYRCVK